MAPKILRPTNETGHGHFYLYGFVALLVLVLLRYLYQTFTSPLRRVPGPLLARFTRLWEAWAIRKFDNPTLNLELHEKYGPIVRLAPNRYSINDGDAARIVLGHHNPLDKSKYYHPFGQPDEYNLFSEPSIAAHSKTKRPIAQLYSQTNLLSYEPFVDTCNAILLKRLEEYAHSGDVLDVRELMQFYAFDVIGEITVGSRFGLMEAGGDSSGIISAIDESMTYGALMGLVPEWHAPLGKVLDVSRIEPNFRKVITFVNHHLDARVSGRTKPPTDRSDFLDKLLPMEALGKATRFHTRQATAQNIAAGSDTTAISLCAVLAYLTLNPHCLATLRAELDAATAAGTLSDPATFHQAQKLPYLQSVILEALRLHPAVGAPLVRVVGPQGLHLAGQYFPPGTEVGVNAWVLHRNTSLYGEDAHLFRPERWMTEDKEERARLDRHFLAFGSGVRTCIGKNISLMEMSKVVPQMVRSYDFEVVGNGEKVEGMGGEGGFTWRTRWFSKPDFRAVVRRRMKSG